MRLQSYVIRRLEFECVDSAVSNFMSHEGERKPAMVKSANSQEVTSIIESVNCEMRLSRTVTQSLPIVDV